MNAAIWVGFNDSNWENLRRIRAWNSEIPVFWDRPADNDINNDIETAKKLGIKNIIIQQTGITPSKVKSVHDAELEIGAWTVNNPSTMEKLLKLSIDRIYTDCPINLLVIKNQDTTIK